MDKTGRKKVKAIIRLGLPHFNWSLKLLGLCLYSFAIITLRFPVGQVGIGIGLVGLIMNWRKLEVPTSFRFYIAFIFWSFASSLTSSSPEVALGIVIECIKLLIVMFLAINSLRTHAVLRAYLLFILVCFICYPVFGTLVEGETIAGRAVWIGPYQNSNELAGQSLLMLGVALAIGFSETNWTLVRFFAWFSALLLLLVILLTQSRGFFIGFLVAVTPAFVSMMKNQFRIALPIVIAISIVINFAVPPEALERLANIQNLITEDITYETDGSAATRLEIQEVGLMIFLDHPVFGVGLGLFTQAITEYYPKLAELDTHNTYLNLAAETGLPGLLLWCATVGSIFRYGYIVRQGAKEGTLKTQHYWIQSAFIGFLVSSIFCTSSRLNLFYIFLSIMWCSAKHLSMPSRKRVKVRVYIDG